MRGILPYIFLYVKGLCIGATGVLHGVSGGSMALLLGVHHRFVLSIRSIDSQAIALLQKSALKAFWKKIDAAFLFTLLVGIASGVVTLRAVFAYYYGTYPIIISSFFFTLVIIAALLLLRKITRWNAGTFLFIAAGLGLSYLLTTSEPLSTPDNFWFAFVSGVAAGGTFVVPGVSGAFILMFFEKYQYILASFGSLVTEVVIPFIVGGVAGIILFARLVANLLLRHFNATVAVFAGLMIGSLNKIWPWREVLEYTPALHGKRVPAFDKSILPWQYLETTGKDPEVFYAILMMALGVLMVVIIEKIASRLKTKS